MAKKHYCYKKSTFTTPELVDKYAKLYWEARERMEEAFDKMDNFYVHNRRLRPKAHLGRSVNFSRYTFDWADFHEDRHLLPDWERLMRTVKLLRSKYIKLHIAQYGTNPFDDAFDKRMRELDINSLA